MLVGRWWVDTGWKVMDGGLVGKCSKTQGAAADWIAHLKRGATTIMALQKWGGRGSDDIGAAVLREE